MPKRMRLTFTKDTVAASAELLERDAPETCAALWEALPFDGTLYHAIWSGPETYLPIDPQIRIAPENQTTQSQIGDIGFYRVDGGRIAGWPDDFSEIAFFYGRGARPNMPTGPVAMNLFARIVDNLDGFAEACDRIRLEGVKPFRMERID